MNLNIKPIQIQADKLLGMTSGRQIEARAPSFVLVNTPQIVVSAFLRQRCIIKKLILLPLLLMVFLRASAQQHYEDSVKSIIAHTKSDSIKLDQYMLLSNYYSANKPDSSIVYAEKIIQWGKIHSDREAINYGVFGKGYAYYKLGNYPAALKLELRVLQDFE
jgi:hypothetical protein